MVPVTDLRVTKSLEWFASKIVEIATDLPFGSGMFLGSSSFAPG